jgi:vaccinia related kinase
VLLGYRKGMKNRVYLPIDFGITCHYLDRNGVRKEYSCDQREAHAGTLEYISRGGHIRAFSLRGDLETLGYNLLQWEDTYDPEYIHSQKMGVMAHAPVIS